MARGSVLSKMSRTKQLESLGMETEMKRYLSTLDLTLLSIGNMVGAGLYVLTGAVAKNVAGPSVMISFMLAGLVSLMAAICYAEFGAIVPTTGSAFIYTYVTIGEIWAFIIGWTLILEYVVAVASVSSAWSGCINQLLDNRIENATITYLLGGKSWDSSIIASYPDIVACVVVCFCIICVCFGVSFSSNLNNICVCLNVLIVGIIFILAMLKADVSNWDAGGGFFAFGFSGVLTGAGTCFYAFVGFDVIATAAEETLTPSKSIPIASFTSVTCATLMYVMASVSLTLMVPYYDIDPTAAFPDALKMVGYKSADVIIGMGSLVGMSSSILGALYSLPRIVYAMASEGLIFPCFASINKRTQVPVVAALAFGSISALLALIVNLNALVEFLSIGTLMAYAIVASAVVILRYQPPKRSTDTADCNSSIADKLEEETNHIEEKQSSMLISRDRYGTLKDKFKTLPIIGDMAPGRAVSVCYVTSVIFQILLITVLCNAPDLSEWWVIFLAAVFGLAAILAFLPIPLHHQNEDFTTFKTPFVPYFPALSTFIDIVLMVKLNKLTWIRFIVWTALGLLIYSFYGYHHSNEGIKRGKSSENNEYCMISSDTSSPLYGTIDPQRLTDEKQD